MQKAKILNRKESKKILAMLNETWGFSEELDYAFIEAESGKIYLAKKDVFGIDLSKVKINSIGLYFAETENGIRLSIEGSQIVGPKASKNVVDISSEEAVRWMKGEDLEKETGISSFVILRQGSDFLGTGRAASGGRILNFVPKTRRIGQ